MEFILALILFVGLVAAWLVAPGSAPFEVSVAPAAEPQPELQGAV